MTDTIEAMVVDDEYLGRQNICALLAKCPRWKVVAEAADGETAVAKIANLRPDVVFLDIDMPNLNGMQVARKLLEKDCLPLTIFVTAYSQYSIQAFEINAVDYLLKPVRSDRFSSTIARVESAVDMHDLSEDRDRIATVVGHLDADGSHVRPWLKQIAIRSIGRVQFVSVDGIVWIGAAGNYVELHIDRKPVLYRQTLASLSGQLNPEDFIQVHRSAIVNRHAVAEIVTTKKGGHVLRLSDGSEVSVSDRSWKRVKELLLTAGL